MLPFTLGWKKGGNDTLEGGNWGDMDYCLWPLWQKIR